MFPGRLRRYGTRPDGSAHLKSMAPRGRDRWGLRTPCPEVREAELYFDEFQSAVLARPSVIAST